MNVKIQMAALRSHKVTVCQSKFPLCVIKQLDRESTLARCREEFQTAGETVIISAGVYLRKSNP